MQGEIISSLSRCDHMMCIVFVSRRLNVAIGWKVRGSNPGLGDNFRTRQPGPWIHPAYYTTNYVSFRGINWPNVGIDHPSPSIANLKKYYALRLRLFNSGPSWPVLGKLRFLKKLIMGTNVVT